MTLIFRPPTEQDLETIAKISDANYPELKNQTTEWPQCRENIREWAKSLNQFSSTQSYVVAVNPISQNVIGCGSFRQVSLSDSKIFRMRLMLHPNEQCRGYGSQLTGTRREYRRRGISTALKIRTIKYAKQNDFKTIITHNMSTNVAMLAVNEKLGFRRFAVEIRLQKLLN